MQHVHVVAIGVGLCMESTMRRYDSLDQSDYLWSKTIGQAISTWNTAVAENGPANVSEPRGASPECGIQCYSLVFAFFNQLPCGAGMAATL